MIDPIELDSLAEDLRGALLRPGEAAYEESRGLWNGMIDRCPAAIVRCRGAADVMSAIRFARDRRLPLSVKAGGHNVAGRAMRNGALTLDLSEMRGIDVNPDARMVRVQPGVTWGALDQETQAFGLATTGGADSRTGVAGLTLGGGIGWLARKHGLAIDNLEAAEVVLADGGWVRTDAEQHPELFWALRGGGGAVGVVTSFTFQLNEVGPEVLSAQAFHRIEDATDALHFYRAFMAGAPDELACYAMFVHVPPMDPFPEEVHGTSALALVACHTGEPAQAERDLRSLVDFGDPLLSDLRPTPYTVLQRSFDAGTPNGQRYYYKTHVLSALDDAVIDHLVRYARELPGAFTIIGIESLGGAIARVPANATAFPHRDALFNLGIWGGWTDPLEDARVIGWTRQLYEAVRPHATGGAYANYLSHDDAERRPDAFGANAARLRSIEARFDPDGIFRAARPAA